MMRIALPARIDTEALRTRDPRAVVRTLGGETMGTSWQLRYAARPGFAPGAVHAAIAGCLAEVVAQMSHWQADSHISRFNRAPAGSWMQLPAAFAQVLGTGLGIAAQTDGAFDPTLGALVALAGFGPPAMAADAAAQGFARARAAAGWQRLQFDRAQGRIRQPGGLWLDLSGIAKGHAVDAVAARLKALGLRHYLIEIGGELVGAGVRPDGDPWWVELEVPPRVAAAPLRLALHELAVATSGNYRRGAHSIDPATGRPVQNGVVAVSVIADTACAADAWATALLVRGMDAGLALASRHHIAARLLGADGQELLSPALAAMLGEPPTDAAANVAMGATEIAIASQLCIG